MNSRQVTGIMAARNAEATIAPAVLSMLAQHELYELLVVDDGSTDQTFELLASIGDPRLRVIRLNASVGRAAARNIAIEQASSPYVAISDADDISLESRLKTLLQLAEDQLAVAVGGQVAHFQDLPTKAFVVHSWPTSDEAIRECLARNVMPFAHPTMLIRTDALRSCGGYDESLQWSEDFDLVRRLAVLGPLAASESIVLLYRRPLRDAWSYMFFTHVARRRAASRVRATSLSAALSSIGAAWDASRTWLRVRVKPQHPAPFVTALPSLLTDD